jgi:8-oxo-dGTP pyrophosphatase MutT (NUDIX family)
VFFLFLCLLFFLFLIIFLFGLVFFMADEMDVSERIIVGIVVFDGEKFLLLHRCLNWRGWEYPKGGIEVGEKPEETLKRELYEETGLKDFEVIANLGDFGYVDKKRNKHVQTHNFLVKVSSNAKVVLFHQPSSNGVIEKEHDSFRWYLPKDAVKTVTHANQKECIKKAMAILGIEE